MAEAERGRGTLAELAGEVLAAGGTVVTANRRLALAIAGAFNASARDRVGAGRSWRSPDVLPWEAWVRREWLRLRDTGGPVPQRAVLGASQTDRVWQRVLETAGAGPVDLPGAAREARRARGLLLGWGLDAEEALGAAGDPQGYRRLHGAYEDRLAARRWTDQAAMERDLAGVISIPSSPVAFAGFDAWTPLQEALAARTGATALTPDHTPPESVVAAPFADAEAELLAAAGWMRARQQRNPGERLALVIPDLAGSRERVEALLADVLSPGPAWDLPAAERRPWNLTMGRPLSEWGPVHTALEALRAVSGPMPFARASRLLRSPWLGAAAPEADARAGAETQLREEGWFELDAPRLATAAAKAGCASLAAGLRAALERQSRGPRSRRLSAWAEDFGELLRDLGWPGGGPVDSETHQLLHAWTETLEALAALDAVSGPVESTGAVAELAALAGERVFQPESADAPIQVLGLLEAGGQVFDAVWVCGLHDLAWPPPLKPNGFLPAGLQREAGMPRACPARELRLARERLDGLVAAAREVVLSWPRAAGDETFRPSPLITGWIAGGDESPFPLPETWAERLAGAGTRTPLAPDRLDPVSGSRSGGTALLADQARCPFRAAAIHRLGGRPLEAPAPGLDPRVRGLWVHAALGTLWRRWGDRQTAAGLDPGERSRQIAAAVAEAREEVRVDAGPADPDHVEIEARRLAALIGELVDRDLERADFRVVATEAPVSVTAAGLELTGRLDRLDRDALGEWIIDYKTGDARPRGWLTPRLPDPQIPAYALASTDLAGVGFAVLRAGDTGYRGLVCGDQAVGPFKPLASQRALPRPGMDWEALKAWWREEVEGLAAEFAGGRAVVAPRDRDACQYCGLDMLCRRHELELPAGDVEGAGGDE